MRLFDLKSSFSEFSFSFQSLGRVARPAFVAMAVAGLVACSSDDEGPRLPYSERPVEDLYNDALDELQSGIYRVAAVLFDEVERQHPYSQWARRSMLMSAYAHYLDQDYDLAILSAERFLSLHPGNANAPYAHYLIGVSYYEQISDVGRDQKITRLALAKLVELVRRYPDTEYARDARLKIDLTRDHLAGKEMEIGRYYLNKRQHIAAINRFRVVVNEYQTTSHVQEALHRLVESYLAIGVVPEAQSAAAVLGYNYPSDRWYKDSYGLLRDSNLSPELMESSWMRDLAKPRTPSPVGPEIFTGSGSNAGALMQPEAREPYEQRGNSLGTGPSNSPRAPQAQPQPAAPSAPQSADDVLFGKDQPSDLTPPRPTKPVERMQPDPMRDSDGNWNPPPVPQPQDAPAQSVPEQGEVDALQQLFGDPKKRRPITAPRFDGSRSEDDGVSGAPTAPVDREPLE